MQAAFSLWFCSRFSFLHVWRAQKYTFQEESFSPPCFYYICLNFTLT